MRLALPLNLPLRERPRLSNRLRASAPPILVVEPDPETGPAAVLRLGDGSIYALTGDTAGKDLGIHYASDQKFGDLPLRTEARSDDLLLVRTSAGARKISLGDLINILET
jgi:hypothetical protein